MNKFNTNANEIIQTVLDDLLDSELFTLAGIARELRFPEDALYDIYTKKNTDPSCSLAFGLIQLHCEHFPALYENVLNKKED